VPTRLVDLTLTLKDGLRTWDIKPPFTMLPYMNAATFKLGFSTKLLVMEDHTGTHVDASLHFYDGVRRTPKGRSIAEMPLEKLYGDAVCIDVSAKPAHEPVTAEMLAAAVDTQKIEIRKEDIVLVRFWSGTWGGDAFLAARGLAKDACEWLLEREVKCVGVDHPNLEGRVADELGNADCPGHVLFLHPDREIPIIENLVGLKGLRGKRFRFFGLPLKIDRATGSPIRAVALVDD
jgi:kynurenine formamidase